MDDPVATYFAAWNEPDPDERRRLLARSVTDDAELVDPTGRSQGVDGLAERIGRYQSVAPGTKVVPASGSTRTTTSCATPGRSSIRRATR